MVKAFVCEACGGRQAEKNQAGLLACAYCGSTHLVNEPVAVSSSQPSRVKKSLLWLLPLLLLVLVLMFRMPSQEGDRKPTNDGVQVVSEPLPVQSTKPEVKPPAPATATVNLSVQSEQASSTRSGGRFWVFGVQNGGDQTLYRPRVVVSLFDADGVRVAEQTGWTHRQIIESGESDVVMVFIKEAPEQAVRQVVQALADTSTFLKPNQLPLPVTHYQVSQQRNRYELVGDVNNPHDHTMRFIKVVAVAQNAAGQPVGVANAYATQKELAPGASSGFKISAGTFMTEAPVEWRVTSIASIKPPSQE